MAAPSKGRFITLEGGEGVGKSTQARLLAERLEPMGIAVVVTREPGGSPGAEALREVILSGKAAPFGPAGEAILFSAARIDHIDNTIAPALKRGAWVISDRFADSTLAYQGYAGGVDKRRLGQLHRLIADDFAPDLTLILDLPTETGLARARQRGGAGEDRFERMGAAFHDKLRAGFLAIAKRDAERCVVIDATLGIEAVQQAVREAVGRRFGVRFP